MSIKDDAQAWTIPEQIVEDGVSGLTFQFEIAPDGERVLRVFGDLPFGNRQFNFDDSGRLAGAGTSTQGLCRPAWMAEIDA